ncbi:hypothetical protein FHR86_003679 [Paenarthrobacter ilicis]|uniref:Uncharacterized protein n=1 Tax=Paenarthrobacter ilicis TaxID=43665 RepID=A0ABX0TNB0_9MICC|nr:hypothetical protein [Paenarthrobacter ilicis]NIJ03320.1 hypothetical protein [Paenarthrobacter ilicis]
MTALVSAAQDLQDYLNLNGWQEQTHGPAGGLWEAENGAIVAVPKHVQPHDFVWTGVIERIASASHTSPSSIESAILNMFVDVTEFRAADDILIQGSIPVEAGFSLMSTARTLLRASATTSRGPKALIGGNYSRPGERIVEKARFGHTIQGSYILPMLVPISRAAEDHGSLLPRDPKVRSAFEPEERRATRTMAQALSAIQNRIVEPAHAPSAAVISDLVIAGVSREMVTALHQLLTEDSVSTFDASFRWATGLDEPQRLPERVEIPAGAAEVLKLTSDRMRPLKKGKTETITGPIVQLRDDQAVVFGDVYIQTMRNGRPCEVAVRLRGHELEQSHAWFMGREVLVIEGTIESLPGQGLRLDNPVRVQPLRETLLFHASD